MINVVFGKTIEINRKNRDIDLVVTETRRNYLVPEPGYHTTKIFHEHLLPIKVTKLKYLWISLSV